jgi:hypothetical protein
MNINSKLSQGVLHQARFDLLKKENETMATNSAKKTLFQKGFLLKGKSKKSKKTVDSIIKPKASTNSNLIFDSVQKEMSKDSRIFKNGEWINSSLLDRIHKNEPLKVNNVGDIEFETAMNEFAKDPKKALQKYEKNEAIMNSFKAYIGILGQHFSDQ